MASSKKAMLKYKKSADKVYFDDEGNAIPFYAMNTEDTFQKAGDPAALIASHLAEERKALEKADITDKETVRQKQLEKKRRRQELERITQQDATPDEYVPEGPIVAFVDDEHPETSKKQKKWFEDNDERDHEGIVEVENLNSLEDQEALALKLMGAA